MPGKDSGGLERLGLLDHVGPVACVGVPGEVERAVDDCVARAEDAVVWQEDHSVSPCVSPPEVVELDFAAGSLKRVWHDLEGLHRGFDRIRADRRDVGPSLGGGLPAGRLVALHLLGDADVRQSRRSLPRPYRVGVGVVTVVMCVEHVADGLLAHLLDVLHQGCGSAREVCVHDQQAVADVDHDVVAVPLIPLAHAEPDALLD